MKNHRCELQINMSEIVILAVCFQHVYPQFTYMIFYIFIFKKLNARFLTRGAIGPTFLKFHELVIESFQFTIIRKSNFYQNYLPLDSHINTTVYLSVYLFIHDLSTSA